MALTGEFLEEGVKCARGDLFSLFMYICSGEFPAPDSMGILKASGTPSYRIGRHRVM